MDKSIIETIVKTIIVTQKEIIGPLAIDQANRVSGLEVATDLSRIEVKGNYKEVLTNLVSEYEKLFGQASVEACKDSIRELLPTFSAKDLPEFLR